MHLDCSPRATALAALALALVGLTHDGDCQAQTPVDAHWMWFDEGHQAAEAPPGKVWFRREVRATEPSTGAVRIASDGQFVLWVNGKRVGEGGGEPKNKGTSSKSYRYNLNGIVERGSNVIAIEADTPGGKAGILVDGEIRGQGGRAISFDSPAGWLATRDEPGQAWLAAGFDARGWREVQDLGPHADSPWKSIEFPDSYLDRYQLAEGFDIERIAEPELVGSLVAITWGNRGRLVASREGGPILHVIDDDGDGVFDRVVEYTNAVTNCQGLCTVGDELYAVGNGPHGTGMYTLPDRDHDDVADEVQLVTKYRGGMGEHGPHSVVLGPDGRMYHNLGNHAWITHEPEPTSPIRDYYEGDLLQPRYEDPNGHAAGVPAPGGTIWRFSPDAKRWSLVTGGFRNHYDIAFNSAGEMFTFDSDMEWEVGMPFYKPVRVTHCTAGAEFGWRSNAGKWPDYYFDSLPAAVDVGRGSPTGVVFYEHDHFPPSYRGALIACDWSMGRIGAVRLERKGSSYAGTWENLVTGNPLNVSDVEVDRDGSLVFATGGRRTEGGLYRVTYRDAPRRSPADETLADALAMPQPSSAWAREAFAKIKDRLGVDWEAGLVQKARRGEPQEQTRALTLLAQLGPPPSTELLIQLTSDDDQQVRAFAAWLLEEHAAPAVAEALGGLLADRSPNVARRAAEAFVASGLEAPVEPLMQLLAGSDRFARFAARLALERVPVEKWRRQILVSDDPRAVTHGLLALHRLGTDALPPVEALRHELSIWDACWRGDDGLKLELLRMIELTLSAGADGPQIDELKRRLLAAFAEAPSPGADPLSADDALRMEASRILCHLQEPQAAAAILEAMEASPGQALQIHYALVTSYLAAGWTSELNGRLFDWYQTTEDWEGGHSFGRWLENIMAEHLAHVPAEDRRRLVEGWQRRPFAARLILSKSEPEAIAGYEELVRLVMAQLDGDPGQSGGEAMVGVAIESLAKSKSLTARETLGKLFEDLPDRREQIARGMSQEPSPEYFPYLVRTLDFADDTTLQLSIAALRAIDRKPDEAGAIRSAILAGLKLGAQGGLAAVDLLEKWTGSPRRGGL
ncbi:MAG: HEAT repeat domain-containing protein, partial [Pirellulales bacterium]